MDTANYVSCGPRLSQGDLVRAPIAVFFTAGEMADPSILAEPESPMAYGDERGVAVQGTWLASLRGGAVLRAWFLPAIIMTPDCGIDKDPSQVLVAPIFRLSDVDPGAHAGIRQRTFLGASYLPSDSQLALSDGSYSPFPESFVDLTRITPVSPSLLLAQRLVALSDGQLDYLHESMVRFIAGREISSTGTVQTAIGQRVQSVEVLESSGRRHTVSLIFESGLVLVLYQEPRRKESHTQSVLVRSGSFDPTSVQAIVGTNLVLRFENEDARVWNLACNTLGMIAQRLAPAATTSILIRCPFELSEHLLINQDRRSEKLMIRVIGPL